MEVVGGLWWLNRSTIFISEGGLVVEGGVDASDDLRIEREFIAEPTKKRWMDQYTHTW